MSLISGGQIKDQTSRSLDRFRPMLCPSPTVPMFARLGARQAGPAFVHPTAGTAIPMVYVLYDKRHFGRVGSPVAGACPFQDPVTADWFAARFAGE